MKGQRASFVSFRELKDRVGMEDILRHYGLLEGLTHHGAEGLTGTCPVHNGTNPTQFRVSLSKNCWNCFGCGKGGNMLDFVAAMETVPLRDAALRVQAWFPNSKPAPAMDSPATRPRTVGSHVYRTSDKGSDEPRTQEPSIREDPTPRSNPPLSFPGLKYLDPRHPTLVEREYQAKTLEHFGSGFCTKGLHAGRLAIPIHNPDGELVAYAGYCLDEERYIYPDGFRKEWELFNLHRVCLLEIEPPHGLILVRDVLDVLKLHEAGCPHAVAFMGEDLSPEQAGLLVKEFGERASLTLFMPHRPEELLRVAARLVPYFYVRIIWPEWGRLRPQDLSVGELWEMFHF